MSQCLANLEQSPVLLKFPGVALVLVLRPDASTAGHVHQGGQPLAHLSCTELGHHPYTQL
jgi:hypothetical protein